MKTRSAIGARLGSDDHPVWRVLVELSIMSQKHEMAVLVAVVVLFAVFAVLLRPGIAFY